MAQGSDATMTTRRFHSRRGKKISFSDNNTVAERVRPFWDFSIVTDNGIVFTEQPVALGTVFQVKILEYDESNFGWAGSIVSV